MGRSKFVCPHCQSDNIQKCSIVYQNGTSNHRYTTTVNGEDLETTGTGHTELAKAVAPPAKQDTSWGAMIVLGGVAVFCIYGGLTIVGIIAAVLALACYGTSQDAEKFNKEEYPKLYNQWLNTYICNRCGHIFTLD